ncbi:uncharacterized protein [Diadema setosum]|uniref:uncharacterized protein n=1 Tax=Diadema setosum TaxID=31175 RepID=UPI003B3A0583
MDDKFDFEDYYEERCGSPKEDRGYDDEIVEWEPNMFEPLDGASGQSDFEDYSRYTRYDDEDDDDDEIVDWKPNMFEPLAGAPGPVTTPARCTAPRAGVTGPGESDFEDYSRYSRYKDRAPGPGKSNLGDYKYTHYNYKDRYGDDDGIVEWEPNMFEPLTGAPGPGAAASAESRARNNDRYLCTTGGYTPMPRVKESSWNYRKPSQKFMPKRDGYPEEKGRITGHPGFQAVCSQQWVRETSYKQYSYTQQYREEARQHAAEYEKSRHMTYGQRARWY